MVSAASNDDMNSNVENNKTYKNKRPRDQKDKAQVRWGPQKSGKRKEKKPGPRERRDRETTLRPWSGTHKSVY